LRFIFEDYALDTDRRELYRGSDALTIAPQVFDLLDYLIRNRERVVSKDDLINVIWNGRAVSDAALTTRLNVARSVISDSGQEQRLIKTLPRKGFRFIGPVVETAGQGDDGVADPPVETAKPALTLPGRPSIAVLPFQNLSGDPEQDYFADGMVQDIITALSQVTSLFVIARNSSFTYKGRAVDFKQIGCELGVRYVLEGSVRKAGGRVRISGQLIEASTGAHLWAEKFDGALQDVFELQDAVTEWVVGAIESSVKQAEINRARAKPTSNLDAYDYYLRALRQVTLYTSEASAAAMDNLRQAIALDPEYALAKAFLSMTYMTNWIQGWGTSGDPERGLAAAREAIGQDASNPSVLRCAGHTLGFWGDHDRSIAVLEKAARLNVNGSDILMSLGWVKCYACADTDRAITHFERAMRLSPRDPEMASMLTGIAFGHLIAGHNEEALAFAQQSIDEGPKFTSGHRVKITALTRLGRPQEARAAAEVLLTFDPEFTIASRLPSYRDSDFRHSYHAALKAAGLPE
jgi:TolB-like protein/Flp pilus assembly protein TadD